MRKSKLSNYPLEEITEYFKTHTIKEVSEHYGMSADTIYAYLKNKGITKPRGDFAVYKNINRQEFIEYYKDHTYDEIAEHFGISLGNIDVIVRKWGIRKERKKIPYRRFEIEDKVLRKEMMEYLALKYSNLDIARLMDLTPARVCQILRGSDE